MTWEVIREYETYSTIMAVSVVIATNEQGRVEPFAFERKEDAEGFAAWLDGTGSIDLVLVYHGVDVLNEIRTARIMRGGLKAVK